MLYIGGVITMCIWALILVVILIGLIAANIKLLYFLIARNKLAKAHVQMVKQQTELRYNRIATMKPEELEAYLSTIFAKMVSLAYDADVSDKDPDIAGKLFFKSTERMITYLGSETIDAIEFYYGKDYVFRWCQLNYTYLSKSGVVQKILKEGTKAITPVPTPEEQQVS